MSNGGSDPFAEPELLRLRQEIEAHGFVTDEFFPNDPDCPVFGVNLACAHPFAQKVAPAYNAMASRLSALDKGVYVYPLWQTHVTIMTFVNFSRYKRPTPEKVEELKTFINPITALIKSVIDNNKIGPFELEVRPPVLSRKAAILPVNNASGEISQIRQSALEMLGKSNALREQLMKTGLNVPGIIHSTILRFKRAPADARQFASGFDSVVEEVKPFSFGVRELLLTAETKPYMRGGQVLHRFALV